MHTSLISQQPQKAWLVATGSLTNLSHLFTKHPDLANHIAGVSIMGGAIGSNFTAAPLGTVEGEGERFGNTTAFAEFNIYCDPEAAAHVFSITDLKGKIVLIPLDLTHLMLGTAEVQKALLLGYDVVDATTTANEADEDAHEPDVVRLLFNEILTFFAHTYATVFGLDQGPPLHDPLAIAACFAPAIFDDRGGERFEVRVITEGEHAQSDVVKHQQSQCGRTSATRLEQGEPGVKIPRDLDTETLWRMLDLCLASVKR